MTAQRGSYPHPVLDGSDDVASDFKVDNVAFEPGMEDIGITFFLRTDDPTLARLLEEHKARVSMRWHCTATLATCEVEPAKRRAIADGHQYETSIDQRQVRDTVAVDVRVLATEQLPGFRWDRQHPDYGDARFDLRKGDVLADGGSFTVSADKLYDPLNPPVGSCFKFVEDPGLHRGMRVTFEDDEAILVRLCPDARRNFRLLTPRPELQISTVVFPALIQAVSFIQSNLGKDNEEDLSERIWFKAIRDRVDAFGGFEGQPAIEIAQKILEHPVDRLLLLEADAEEGEE